MTPHGSQPSASSTVLAFVRELSASFDATDALDIIALSVLLYLALVGLLATRIGQALRGALWLGAIYLLARQLNLKLTFGALEGFFVLALVALVMIYRDELRRMMERFSRITGRRATPAGDAPLADLLGKTLFELARARCGAIVVVEGREAVEPHVRGGVALNGEPSRALLHSIFDTGSPGHDGALLIEAGRVARFAMHLPLSDDIEQLAGRGTRHAATLGLSERCDALCIVVSEERGVVAIAEGGRMHEVSSAPELTEAVRQFVGVEPSRRTGLQRLVFEHHWGKLGSVCAAALAWLVIVYGGESLTRSFDATVVVRDVAPTLKVLAINPTQVQVVATGARRDFALSTSSTVRVAVSLRRPIPGEHHVNVSPENVSLPAGLAFKSVTPAVVAVGTAKQ